MLNNSLDYFGTIIFREGRILKKYIIVLLIIAGTIILATIFMNSDNVSNQNMKEESSKQITNALNSVADEFGFFSFQIDQTDSSIWIVMDETKSEAQLKEYLEKNINKNHLNQYTFHFKKTSPEKIKIEEVLSEVFQNASEYIKNKGYQDVTVIYPSLDPESSIKVIISKDSERSNEDLQKELEDLLNSKISELQKMDIHFQLQVIKEP